MQRAADGARDWQTSSHIVWGGWGGAGGMCRPAVVLLRLRWWLSRSASWAHPEADTDVGAETASKSGCIALTENRFTQSSNTPGPRVEHTPEPLGRPGRQSGSPAIRGRSRQFAVPLVAAQRDMKGERGAEGCRWSSRLADQFAYRLGRLGRGGRHVQTSSGAPSTTLVAQQIC